VQLCCCPLCALQYFLFYVFNIEYQELASATLELIQRFLVRINPEGTKCTAKAGVTRKTGKVVQRKPLPINPHVTRFLADLKELEWKNMRSRKEELQTARTRGEQTGQSDNIKRGETHKRQTWHIPLKPEEVVLAKHYLSNKER
uniref:Uncharacterized protein n=1 Tax=Hucho hucho TaxID=62062 RepID=A0A4W5RBH1_9TELE